MTRDELDRVIREEIGNVAPDADLETLDPAADIREALDLDSMDVMNIVIALHERLDVDIPDADARKLLTLNGAIDYLAAKLG